MSFPDCPVGEALFELDTVPILFGSSPMIGALVGHASNNGMSGVTLDLRGSLEKMRAKGIKGRLIKLCQGQLDGSSVRRMSNILIMGRVRMTIGIEKEKVAPTLPRGIHGRHTLRMQY